MDHLCDSDLFNCGLYFFLFILSELSDVRDMDGVERHVCITGRDQAKGNSSKTDENRYIELLPASTHLIIVHQNQYEYRFQT